MRQHWSARRWMVMATACISLIVGTASVGLTQENTPVELLESRGAKLQEQLYQTGIDPVAETRKALDNLAQKLIDFDTLSMPETPEITLESDVQDATVAALIPDFSLALADGRRLDLGMTALNARISPDGKRLVTRLAFGNPILLTDAYDQTRRLALREQDNMMVYNLETAQIDKFLLSLDLADMNQEGAVTGPIRRLTLSYPDHKGFVMLTSRDGRAQKPTIMQPDPTLGFGVVLTRFINLF